MVVHAIRGPERELLHYIAQNHLLANIISRFMALPWNIHFFLFLFDEILSRVFYADINRSKCHGILNSLPPVPQQHSLRTRFGRDCLTCAMFARQWIRDNSRKVDVTAELLFLHRNNISRFMSLL